MVRRLGELGASGRISECRNRATTAYSFILQSGRAEGEGGWTCITVSKTTEGTWSRKGEMKALRPLGWVNILLAGRLANAG